MGQGGKGGGNVGEEEGEKGATGITPGEGGSRQEAQLSPLMFVSGPFFPGLPLDPAYEPIMSLVPPSPTITTSVKDSICICSRGCYYVLLRY